MTTAHTYRRMRGTIETDVVIVYANVSIGATGAPTLNTAPGSKGITSVTRNSAGDYTFVFDENYQKLLFANVQLLDATLSDPTAVGTIAKVKAVTEAAAGGSTVEVVFYEMATPAAAVDPRNGATLLAQFHFRYSTVQ